MPFGKIFLPEGSKFWNHKMSLIPTGCTEVFMGFVCLFVLF